MCPACGTTQTCTVAGEAARNQRAAADSSATVPAGDDQRRPTAVRADRVGDAHRPRRTADQPGSRVLHPLHAARQRPVDPVRQPAAVGDLLAFRALGDYGAHPRIRPGRDEGLLSAHGLAEQGDLARTNTGLPVKERHRRGDVPVTPPAEVHRVPPDRP